MAPKGLRWLDHRALYSQADSSTDELCSQCAAGRRGLIGGGHWGRDPEGVFLSRLLFSCFRASRKWAAVFYQLLCQAVSALWPASLGTHWKLRAMIPRFLRSCLPQRCFPILSLGLTLTLTLRGGRDQSHAPFLCLPWDLFLLCALHHHLPKNPQQSQASAGAMSLGVKVLL